MAVVSLDTHPRRAFDALVPASARKCLAALGGFSEGGFGDASIIGAPDTFSLSRHHGATVWLHCVKLTVNLNIQLKHEPGSYRAARQWVATLEKRFGIRLPERSRRRRTARPALRIVPPAASTSVDAGEVP